MRLGYDRKTAEASLAHRILMYSIDMIVPITKKGKKKKLSYCLKADSESIKFPENYLSQALFSALYYLLPYLAIFNTIIIAT